jgi:Tol biopolymer transport system component
LSEEKRGTLDFYTLDPKRGPAAKPFKTTSNFGFAHDGWSLSPDGQYIALVENNEKGQVQVLNLSKGTIRRLELGRWTHLQTISWSPNGRTLYVTSFASLATTLLSVELDGHVTILFQQGHNWLCCPKAAPNNRLLAFLVAETQGDAAMIENF